MSAACSIFNRPMDYASLFTSAMVVSLLAILFSMIIGIFRLNMKAALEFGPMSFVLLIFGMLVIIVFVLTAFAGVLLITIEATAGVP